MRRFVDDDGVADTVLELGDTRLEHRLIVLGSVVLRVLGDLAKVAGFLDAFGDFAPTTSRKVLDLGLELLVALGSDE